jgi:hypothetical protein
MAKHEPQIRDRRKPGWFYLDDAVIDQHGPTIGPYGVAVYTGLARHANAQGETSVGYNRLATTLAMSRNKVISTLRALADEGLITIEPQTDDSGNPIAANIYTLCVIPDQKRVNSDRGVPHSGRGVPQYASPHAQNGTPVPQSGRGVPQDACEGILPNHGGDSDSGDRAPAEKTIDPEFVRQLCLRRAQGKPMNQKSAEKIARRVLAGQSDEQTILISLDMLIAADTGMGAIVDLLNNDATIPPKGQPYARPGQPRPATNGHDAPNRPRRSGNNTGHNPDRDAEFAAQLAEFEQMAAKRNGDVPPL